MYATVWRTPTAPRGLGQYGPHIWNPITHTVCTDMHQADAAQPQQTQSAGMCVFCPHADRRRQRVRGEAEKIKEENTDGVQICARDVTFSSDLQYGDDTYKCLKRLTVIKSVGFFLRFSKTEWELQIGKCVPIILGVSLA